MDGGSITVLLFVTTHLYVDVGQCLVPQKLYSVVRHDVIYVCAVDDDDIAMVPFPLRHRIVRFQIQNCLFDIVCQVIVQHTLCIINVRRLPLRQ